MASLDRNLVWYVKTEVNGQDVLAPKLYLAPSLTLNPGINGALIAGREVTVQTSALVNSGLVASADDLSVVTLGDLANLGGTLSSGGNQSLTAGGSVLNESQSHSWTEATGFNAGMRGTGSSSGIDATAQITSGGSLSITANKSVAGTASVISSGRDLKIAAGQDVTMGTLDLTQVSDWGSGGERYHFDSTTVVGSQIRSGGAAAVSAGNDLVLSASSLSAAGTAGLTAGRDLALLAEANQQTYSWDRRSGGGFFSDKSSDIGTRSVTSYTGSSVTSSGGDVALSSGRNTTLNAAELKAGKHLSVTLAPDGTLTLGAVKDSDYLDRKTSSSNFAWQSQEQQGHFIETVRQTLLTAGEGFTITAPGGIKVEYHDTGNLDDSIRQLSALPGLEYLKQLRQTPNVDWVKVNAAYQSWDYKSEGLSGPMSALIMIAVAIATQGAGAELLGLTAGADGAIAVGAANAALTTLIGTATVSLINNKGNLGKVLSAVASTDFVRQLAISLLTMDVSNGVAGGTISSASSSFLEKAIAAAQQQLLRAAVNTAVQATIGGQKLSDALKSSLTAALAMGFGQLANGAVGDAIKSQDWTPGGPESVLLHGMVGFVQGQLANGNGLAGAFGAGAAEALTPMISDFLADHGIALGTDQYARLMLAGAQSIGTIIGGLTAGDAGGVAGGQTAASSIVYNWLSHEEASALVTKKNALAKCQAAGTCSASELVSLRDDIEALQALSDDRDTTLVESCLAGGFQCLFAASKSRSELYRFKAALDQKDPNYQQLSALYQTQLQFAQSLTAMADGVALGDTAVAMKGFDVGAAAGAATALGTLTVKAGIDAATTVYKLCGAVVSCYPPYVAAAIQDTAAAFPELGGSGVPGTALAALMAREVGVGVSAADAWANVQRVEAAGAQVSPNVAGWVAGPDGSKLPIYLNANGLPDWRNFISSNATVTNVTGSRSPFMIKYSQDSISSSFRQDVGLVQELVDGLKSGRINPVDIPPIRVFSVNGELYTLDNRRLYAFQQAELPINVKPATQFEIEMAKRNEKFSTLNGGVSIHVRN